MSPLLENFLLNITDGIFSLLPQKIPSKQQLKNCRLVSHRGDRDGVTVFENTFAAFDPVLEQDIWGIELDVRWTKDLVPVVIHDENTLRVFAKDFTVAEHTWQECQVTVPELPSLAALINRYGKRCHLMIELKQEIYPDPARQKQILQELLSTLKPTQDFHIIVLDTDLFTHVDFLPSSALLPVSTTNAKQLSELSLKKQLGGVTGHYLFMTKALIAQHKAQGQQVGSGFANTEKVLYREINKNVDWIFSNQAVSMQRIIQRHLENPLIK